MEQFKQNVCSYLSSVNNINKDGNPLLVNPQSQSDSDSQCFQNGLRWLVTFKSPVETWNEEPTFLFIQISVILGSILNFIHAWKNGGRFIHFWWATIIVSFVTECVCYLIPNIDSYWHAQGVVGLFGKRFPLYIVFVYNQFWYTAWVAVLRMNLKWWAEPFAVGVAAVLIDLPYDIMGVKMLWWTWHDTDANIFDRHYHVPWTSYYFHSSFLAAMLFIFFGSRKLLMPSKSKFESGNCLLEWLCTMLSGWLAMPVGSVVFIMLFYHPLHDWLNVHSEVPVMMWLAVCLLITWISDRNSSAKSRTGFTADKLFSLPVLNVVQHFLLFILLMFVAKPEEVRSTGLHQTIGPCNETEDTFSISGAILPRQKYLCPENYEEAFDFHCRPGGNPPPSGSSWYTMCGTPYENPMEYKLIIWFCCAIGLLVYCQILLFSGDQLPARQTLATAKQTTLSPTSKKLNKKKNRKQE